MYHGTYKEKLFDAFKGDAPTSLNNIKENVNWIYTTVDDTKVFAIYSTIHIENPTLLYESKGKQSDKKMF